MRSLVAILFLAAAIAFTSAGPSTSASQPLIELPRMVIENHRENIQTADYGCPDHSVCDYYCRTYNYRGGYCAPCPYNGVCYCWLN